MDVVEILRKSELFDRPLPAVEDLDMCLSSHNAGTTDAAICESTIEEDEAGLPPTCIRLF